MEIRSDTVINLYDIIIDKYTNEKFLVISIRKDGVRVQKMTNKSVLTLYSYYLINNCKLSFSKILKRL